MPQLKRSPRASLLWLGAGVGVGRFRRELEEGGGVHAPLPFLPPFFFLLSLIMKYCDQAANEPKLPPVSLFFAFRLSLQSKLLLPASCSSNMTPAGPSPLPPRGSFQGYSFLSPQFTQAGEVAPSITLKPAHRVPPPRPYNGDILLVALGRVRF